MRSKLLIAALFGVVLFWTALSGQAPIASEAGRLFDLLELKPGMTVGEIGAGRGEMTIEMATRLGPAGRVHSNEIDPARLAEIRQAVADKKLTNVTIVTGGDATTNFPAGCCDAIFMRDVYHHLTNPKAINANIFAALKPGGRFVVIDFEPRPNMTRPEGVPANREGHGIGPQIVVDEGAAVGFTLSRPAAEWATSGRSNARMFVVVMTKPR